MQHKKLKVGAVFFLSLGLTSVQAQTMYVKESSGTQTTYDLKNIQKITFSEGNTTIQKTDNSTVSFALGAISYINFDNLVTSVEDQVEFVNHSNLAVYPNPVGEVLSIDLSSLKIKQGTLSVLTLDGSTVLTQPTQGNETETLNISALTSGIYLFQFTNEKETKTVKIIKE